MARGLGCKALAIMDVNDAGHGGDGQATKEKLTTLLWSALPLWILRHASTRRIA